MSAPQRILHGLLALAVALVVLSGLRRHCTWLGVLALPPLACKVPFKRPSHAAVTNIWPSHSASWAAKVAAHPHRQQGTQQLLDLGTSVAQRQLRADVFSAVFQSQLEEQAPEPTEQPEIAAATAAAAAAELSWEPPREFGLTLPGELQGACDCQYPYQDGTHTGDS